MRSLSVALLLVAAGSSGLAQKFSPERLAPSIPTPPTVVDRMLEAGHVRASDVVYDLGSGDGGIVIAAAQKYGARAVGVEMLPDLCRQAQRRIRELGLDDRASIVE